MRITLEIPTHLPVADAWSRLTDWRAHSQWIPLTKMIILNESPESPGIGDKFVGRTGIGPLAFDDVMTVTKFQQPNPTGFCEVTKSGRLIKGSASFTVEPAEGGSLVTWVEDITLPKYIDALFARPLAVLGEAVFHSSLRKALKA